MAVTLVELNYKRRRTTHVGFFNPPKKRRARLPATNDDIGNTFFGRNRTRQKAIQNHLRSTIFWASVVFKRLLVLGRQICQSLVVEVSYKFWFWTWQWCFITRVWHNYEVNHLQMVDRMVDRLLPFCISSSDCASHLKMCKLPQLPPHLVQERLVRQLVTWPRDKHRKILPPGGSVDLPD